MLSFSNIFNLAFFRKIEYNEINVYTSFFNSPLDFIDFSTLHQYRPLYHFYFCE